MGCLSSLIADRSTRHVTQAMTTEPSWVQSQGTKTIPRLTEQRIQILANLLSLNTLRYTNCNDIYY